MNQCQWSVFASSHCGKADLSLSVVLPQWSDDIFQVLFFAALFVFHFWIASSPFRLVSEMMRRRIPAG
ncbi:MAG: hypothetical protein CMM01_18810 [Rhodopirellula sp.]|nr:hypothetical protein [Rhodopirellula sp.]